MTTWVCQKCQAHNADDHTVCQMCGAIRPGPEGSPIAHAATARDVPGIDLTDPTSTFADWRQPQPAPFVDPLSVAQAVPMAPPPAIYASRPIWPWRWVLSAFIATTLIVGGLYYAGSRQILIASGAHTMGIVDGTRTYACGRYGTDTCVNYVVRYAATATQSLETSVYSNHHAFRLSSPRFYVGEPVPVYFDRANPANAIVDYPGSTLDQWSMAGAGAILLLIILATRPRARY